MTACPNDANNYREWGIIKGSECSVARAVNYSRQRFNPQTAHYRTPTLSLSTTFYYIPRSIKDYCLYFLLFGF